MPRLRSATASAGCWALTPPTILPIRPGTKRLPDTVCQPRQSGNMALTRDAALATHGGRFPIRTLPTIGARRTPFLVLSQSLGAMAAQPPQLGSTTAQL